MSLYAALLAALVQANQAVLTTTGAIIVSAIGTVATVTAVIWWEVRHQ